MSKINIIGSGLVGSLLSIYLVKKGHTVTIYERRPDMRKNRISAGRSINLALSDRGWKGLDFLSCQRAFPQIEIDQILIRHIQFF